MTELFIVLVIRTRRRFFRSRPGTLLLAATLARGEHDDLPALHAARGAVRIRAAAAGFVVLLLGITGAYLVASELAKHRFYARSAGSA